ncbi:hypothetical protein ACA910_019432 [Epithemia clementina (nom. ined.)]
MGNAQCLAEPGRNIDDENVMSYYGPSAKSYAFEVPDLQGNFLKLHLHERPGKCIIDPRLVVEALARQAEELVRRELDDGNENDPRLAQPYEMRSVEESSRVSSSMSTPSDMYGKIDIASILSSIGPSTVTTNVTSCSASTRIAGNYDRYSPSGKQKRTEPPYAPPRMLGSGVDLGDTLHQDLINMIEGINKEDERKIKFPSMVPEEPPGCHNHYNDNTSYQQQPQLGCSILPLGTILSRGRTEPHFSGRTAMHMIVLHLRLTPRCAEFYESHLSRFLPDSPFVRAVTNGISSSELAPSAPRRCMLIPELLRNDSDSASSRSAEIDFGAGPPSLSVKLLVDDSSFLDLGLTGSLGLIERQRPDVLAQRGRKFLSPPEHYLVLMNQRSGVPLAVCALRTGEMGDPVVRIYATKPRTFVQQRPVATTRKLGLDWTESLPLYAWAEIVTRGRYPNNVRYSIFHATGNDGRFEEVPSYIAEHSSVGSPEIRVLGKTEREAAYSGCAVLCLSRDEDASEDDLYFRLSVSKGVDPALFICFAAFVDEAMERTMRIQSQALTESLYRVTSI